MLALLPAAAIVFAAAITPGPNTVIVMSAAAQGGVRGAAPAIAGVVAGSLLLLGCTSISLATLVATDPRILIAVSVLGFAYLIWMGAAMILGAEKAPSATDRRLPSTMCAVAVFQLVNPKAWLLILGATATAAADSSTDSVGLWAGFGLAVTIVAVTGSSLLVWALVGVGLSRWMDRSSRRKTFERAMGALLVASALLLFVYA
jgi:threonine/homoserine/homoserine lactone efflux protein